MGQTSYIYILWIVILAAGLWVIVGFGSTVLHAPEDLAGEWELVPEKPSEGVAVTKMRVEQSGRYFNITLRQGKAFRMKRFDESIVNQHFGERKRIELRGDNSGATFEGMARGDLWRLTLTGNANGDDIRGEFVARLVERTYPKPLPATRPTLASANAR